jgi:hypothetical protein
MTCPRDRHKRCWPPPWAPGSSWMPWSSARCCCPPSSGSSAAGTGGSPLPRHASSGSPRQPPSPKPPRLATRPPPPPAQVPYRGASSDSDEPASSGARNRLRHSAGLDPGQPRFAPGFMGANCGSQCAQIRLDPLRLLRNVTAGRRLLVRLPQTRADTGFVPGGQGVAGSNPAVPTQVRVVLTGVRDGPERCQGEPISHTLSRVLG